MSFPKQPTLSSDLIELRPLRLADRAQLFSAASDPKLWEQHPAHDRYKKEEFENYFADAIESGGALLIKDAETGEVIGSSRYHGYSEQNSEVEIGWTFLVRSHWGGQYNAELKRLMFEHAFKYVQTIVFRIGAENARSQKSVEKIGGVRDANLDDKGRVVYRVQKPKLENPA